MYNVDYKTTDYESRLMIILRRNLGKTTATLQNVEYRKPLTVWGELQLILEKIFAPLQAPQVGVGDSAEVYAVDCVKILARGEIL